MLNSKPTLPSTWVSARSIYPKKSASNNKLRLLQTWVRKSQVGFFIIAAKTNPAKPQETTWSMIAAKVQLPGNPYQFQ
jgi:hypothetical protein